MSVAPHPAIRPGIESLRNLPSLRRETRVIDGVEGLLELKMENEERRYWVCSTQVAGVRLDRLPEAFRPDHITMEVFNVETEEWDPVVYGPEKTKELQLVDYFELLGKRLDELLAREAPDSPEETRRELAELHSEFLTLRKLLSLESKAQRAAVGARV